jgi:hypothetical protein
MYAIIILPTVLHGYKTWSLTLREEFSRLWMFDNRMLMTVLETNRKDETGGWRKLHNGQLHR